MQVQSKAIEMVTMQPPKIISKETIKPSSPTPNHLKNYNLSLLDQLSPHFYLPMVLFYPDMGRDYNITDITNRLKKSLSEILTSYYPFAGRLANKVSIECNDQGVDFFEAQMNCSLSDILEKPDPQIIDLFYPTGILWNESYKGSLVVVQVTFFNCGAMAISKCMLHKIADGSTAASFFSDWASMARRYLGHEDLALLPPHPEFISKSLLPPNDPPIVEEFTKIDKLGNTCITRRFVFDASKLAALKAMVTALGVPNPTRVDVVCALIYKCAMAASSKASSKPFVFLQPINLRPRIVPPMPINSVGNFAWISRIIVKDEGEKELHNLVGAIKSGIAQFNDKFGKNLTANECYARICDSIKLIMNKKMDHGMVDVYKGSSLCRYPFHEINFGWGKPIWAGTSSSIIKNTFLFKDAPEFGIEAWITLEEQEMAIFECDQELLAFASLNPSVNFVGKRF